jgi:ribosome-associated protein
MAKKSTKTADTTEQLIHAIVKGIQEVKGKDILLMDLRKVEGAVADYFVISHGSSNTQVEAIARSVEKETEEQVGEHPWHLEGMRNAQWILMDYVNVIVHVFEESFRNYYDLEGLWADASVMKVEAA